MIAWQPRLGVPGPWHLTHHRDEYLSLCGRRVKQMGLYVKRDPHKIDDHRGERCARCWAVSRMESAASYARQDQWEAER